MLPSWTCPTCLTTLATGFCPECGERAPHPRELTLRGLAEQFFHGISSVDSKLLRSLRTLITAPGALTVAYLEGRRMPYLRPFPLFLLANVLFFAIQSLTGTNVFSSSLDSHLHHQDWSPLASELLAGRLQATNQTLVAYAPAFDRAVVLNAKSLIILMTVPFALLLQLMQRQSGRPFVVQFVFALHLYAFLLLLFCASLVLAGIDVVAGGPGLAAPVVDTTLSAINLAFCAAYLHLAMGRVYGGTGPRRLLKTVVLSVAVAAIGLGYRLLLFLLTLYTT